MSGRVCPLYHKTDGVYLKKSINCMTRPNGDLGRGDDSLKVRQELAGMKHEF